MYVHCAYIYILSLRQYNPSFPCNPSSSLNISRTRPVFCFPHLFNKFLNKQMLFKALIPPPKKKTHLKLQDKQKKSYVYFYYRSLKKFHMVEATTVP